MHEGHHAIDLGIIIKNAGAVDGVGHELGDGGRAIHRGQDADIVARAHRPIGAPIPLEGCTLLLWHIVHRHHPLGKGIVMGQRAVGSAHAAIVLMYPVARHDGFLGKADDLAELDYGLSCGNCAGGKLVPALITSLGPPDWWQNHTENALEMPSNMGKINYYGPHTQASTPTTDALTQAVLCTQECCIQEMHILLANMTY